ncbi:SDR family oxidoreductase [Rhodovibrionaceae bacterium A322]
MSFDFTGKNVVVAGGTNGINQGVAHSFAKAGASVFVFSRRQEKVDATVKDLEAHGGKAAGCVADVRDFEAVKTAFATFKETFGVLDILVSGAAGNFPALANDISSNGFRAVMEIDVLGTHHVMTAAYPHLKKPGASVINISSAHSYVAQVGQSHVCAAKAGVDMITRSLALEWGADGIRINSVAPGPIANSGGMDRLYATEDQLAAKIASVPLGRLGSHEDIGNVCQFLSSDMASYITGVLLPTDGGSGLNTNATRLASVLPLPRD